MEQVSDYAGSHDMAHASLTSSQAREHRGAFQFRYSRLAQGSGSEFQ